MQSRDAIESPPRNMAGAKKIQDDSADLKFALDATKKALDDIESRRGQRSPTPPVRRREKREDGGGDDEMDEEELEAEMDSKGRGTQLLSCIMTLLRGPFHMVSILHIKTLKINYHCTPTNLDAGGQNGVVTSI